MIALILITNTEIYAFIAVLFFMLLSRKVLFINKKDNKKLLKNRLLLRKWQISLVNYCKIINN